MRRTPRGKLKTWSYPLNRRREGTLWKEFITASNSWNQSHFLPLQNATMMCTLHYVWAPSYAGGDKSFVVTTLTALSANHSVACYRFTFKSFCITLISLMICYCLLWIVSTYEKIFGKQLYAAVGILWRPFKFQRPVSIAFLRLMTDLILNNIVHCHDQNFHFWKIFFFGEELLCLNFMNIKSFHLLVCGESSLIFADIRPVVCCGRKGVSYVLIFCHPFLLFSWRTVCRMMFPDKGTWNAKYSLSTPQKWYLWNKVYATYHSGRGFVSQTRTWSLSPAFIFKESMDVQFFQKTLVESCTTTVIQRFRL